MSQLNFSYVITEPADGAWGVRTAGGDWSGMIGQLVDREVMLGAAAFAISQASRKSWIRRFAIVSQSQRRPLLGSSHI